LKDRDLAQADLDEAFGSRIASETFLKDHLPGRINVTDAQVRAYYEEQKEKRFLGKAYSEVQNIVRESLKRETQAKEFDSWLQTEMRRTEVLILPVRFAEVTSGKSD